MVASKFEKATSVKQFKSVAAKSHPVPKGYSTMTATLNVDAEECSLYHVREIKDSIVERANLEPYVTLVQDIHASFVVLTIALPAAVCQHVKSALDVDFLLGLGILPDSVTFGSVPGQRMFFSRLASIRNLFISKGTREEVLKPVSSGQTVSSSESSNHHKFHHFRDDEASSLMPDPPQNVREEVSISGKATMRSSLQSLPGPQPTLLTREALRQHDEQMQTDVRQFCCPDCDLSWWRVVPANKPVSRCKNCHLKFDPLPRWCECGVRFFTCPNRDCQNVFYTDCMGDAHRECPNCFSFVGGPYIHPDIEPKRYYGQIWASQYHFSTGSTYDTWLSQPSSLAGDRFSSTPLSPLQTRTYFSSPLLRYPRRPSSLANNPFSYHDEPPSSLPRLPRQTRTSLSLHFPRYPPQPSIAGDPVYSPVSSSDDSPFYPWLPLQTRRQYNPSLSLSQQDFADYSGRVTRYRTTTSSLPYQSLPRQVSSSDDSPSYPSLPLQTRRHTTLV